MLTVVVLGDSIAAGIGVRGASYGDLIGNWLKDMDNDVSLVNLSGSAMQVSDSKRLLHHITRANPTCVVIAHGITEAIVRPTSKALKLMPSRWQRAGWMDPRPYYSQRWWKRVGQKIESGIRWRVKVVLMRVGGGVTWTPQREFEDSMADFIDDLLRGTSADVILVSHCGIDERYFPDSLSSLDRYMKSLENAVIRSNSNRVHLCNLSNSCDKWGDFFDDHFHPNAGGHLKIARKLYLTISHVLTSRGLSNVTTMMK